MEVSGDLPMAYATATPRQVTALQIEFRELGYTSRRERLAAAADALSADQISSFSELSMGQAGFLFGCLRHGDIPSRDQAIATWRTSAHAGRGAQAGTPLRPRRRSPAEIRASGDLVTVVAVAVVVVGWTVAMVRQHWYVLRRLRVTAPTGGLPTLQMAARPTTVRSSMA